MAIMALIMCVNVLKSFLSVRADILVPQINRTNPTPRNFRHKNNKTSRFPTPLQNPYLSIQF